MVNHNKVERVEFRSKPVKVTRPPEPRHQIQAVSKLQVAAWNAYKEAQRKKTGFFGSDIGSVPKDEWDRMTWEHRDAIVKAREAATSAALSVLGGVRVPPRVIEVPALIMPRSIWGAYRHQDPSTVKGFLNQALAARYRHAGVPVPRSTAPYVFHNPDKLADRLTRAFENLPDDPGAFADRLASRGVYHIGVRETGARQGLLHGSTGEEVGAQMRNLWQEHRVLPIDSVYLKFKGDKYIRGSNHHSDIIGVRVTPDKRAVIRDDPHVKGAAGDLITPGAPARVPHTLLVTEDAENTVVLPVLRGSQSTQAGGLPMGGGRMYPGGILGVQQDNRGGDSSKQSTPRRSDMANFLATDEVPETLFGIPVVSTPEQYTESDIAFFKEHPKAGGFYELGDEDTDTQAAEGAEGTSESHRRAPQVPSGDIRELWNRAVKSTGNLDEMARVFAAMTGESSLNQRGATAEQISNGHLARLLVHANETDRYNGNPHNSSRRTVMDTVNKTSHVLSKHEWGTGPSTNWFDVSKMEPRFDLINADPVASRTARDLIMNVARFLNGDLHGRDWLPSDAISYGDGSNGLMPDREDIKPIENRIGPMPDGFRIGRKKGAK